MFGFIIAVSTVIGCIFGCRAYLRSVNAEDVYADAWGVILGFLVGVLAFVVLLAIYGILAVTYSLTW